MPGRLTLLVIALSLGLPLAAPAQAPERVIDSMLAPFNEGVSPGAAVAVVRDGKIVFSKGYGMASLEHRVPITPSTVFDVASVSKQFAGLAIAMLVTQGKLKLTDDIRTHIPELPDVGHTITIDHLVHHTSGLRDWPGMLRLAGWQRDDVISFEQILTFAYHQRTLNFVPGAEYTYSNTGFNLLAEVVARVSGRSFRQWTDEHLFRPLGMTRSHFHDDHAEVVPDRAFGYVRSEGQFIAITDNLTALGSSSLFTTVTDLARWVANFDDARVGGADAMRLSRTRGVLNNGTTIPYAFGIVHGEYRGTPTLTHGGGWAGFSTIVLHLPEHRFGVIVLANSPVVPSSRTAYAIVDRYLGDRLGPAPPAENPLAAAPTVEVAPAVLDRYAGLYRLEPGWFLQVRRKGPGLVVQATRESEVPMAARSDTSFWVDAYGAMITFHRAEEGVELEYRDRRRPKLDEHPAPASSALSQLVGTYHSDELDATYEVVLKDGQLALEHRRHGRIPLVHLWRDEFGTAAGIRSILFRRDGGDRVVGFAADLGERSRDVRFARRP